MHMTYAKAKQLLALGDVVFIIEWGCRTPDYQNKSR